MDNSVQFKAMKERAEQAEAKVIELEEIETDLNNTIGFLENGIKDWKRAKVETSMKAAKLLVDLIDAQAQLKEHEWVSVEDRLPEEPTDENGTPISVSANEGHLGTMWLFPGTNWLESFDRLKYTHWRYTTPPKPVEERKE